MNGIKNRSLNVSLLILKWRQANRQTDDRRRSQYLKLFSEHQISKIMFAIKGLIKALILLTRKVFKI